MRRSPDILLQVSANPNFFDRSPDETSTIVRFIPVATSSPPSSAPRKRALRSGTKGETTRASILDAAVSLAASVGLDGLSIGAVAELTGMSKSGVFAHFGSREELQISVIRTYHEQFRKEVFEPSMQAARGLPRLRELFERWLRRVSHEVESGCLYISGAVEFDDQPGPVRDALEAMVRAWRDAMERSVNQAIELQHLRADTQTDQLLFEIHALILALHHDARFLRQPGAVDRARRGFERLIGHQQSQPTL